MDKVRAKIDFDSQFTKSPSLKKKTRKGTAYDCCDDLGVEVFDLKNSVRNSLTMVRDNLNSQNSDIEEINNKIKKCEDENIKLKMIVEINDDNNLILSNEQLKTMNDLKTNLPADEYKDFEKDIDKKLTVNRIKKFLAYFELLIPLLGGIVAFVLSVTRAVGINSKLLTLYTNVLHKFGDANKDRIVRIINTLSSAKAPASKATKTTAKTLATLEDEGFMKIEEYPWVANDDDKEDKDTEIKESDHDKIHNTFAYLANYNFSIRKKVNVPKSLYNLRNLICDKITVAMMLFTFMITIDIYYNTNILTSALKSIAGFEFDDNDDKSGGGGKKNKKKQKKSLKYYNDMFIKSLENSIKNSY